MALVVALGALTVMAVATAAAAVAAAASTGTSLFAGGSQLVQGQPLADFDGIAWRAVNGLGGASATVTSMSVLDGGVLLVAGDVLPSNIASLNQTQWQPVGGGRPFPVTVAALTNGGTQMVVGSQSPTTGESWLEIWDGATWREIADVAPIVVVQYQNMLVVGGSFGRVNGVPARNIAAYDGAAWSTLAAGTNGGVLAFAGLNMTQYNGELLAVGGAFTIAGQVGSSGAALWNGAAWVAPSMALTGTVCVFLWYQGELYVGGNFVVSGLENSPSIATWDGQNYAPVGSGLNGTVLCLQSYDNALYAGGQFEDASGGAPYYIAVLAADASEWIPVYGVASAVRSLAVTCTSTRSLPDCLVCIPAHYGPRCLDCAVCALHGTCTEGLDGNCTCWPTWQGVDCSDCIADHYGSQCAPCSDCGPHATCFPGAGGNCTCEPEWAGPLCNVCAPGRFGPDCISCTLCQNGTCNQGLDGNCTCFDGFQGPWCDDCLPGRYSSSCLSCDQCNGNCTPNAPGRLGSCVCAPGFVNSPACDQCVSGFYGPFCNLSCQMCEVHGACTEGPAGGCDCTDPWTGPECLVCVPQYGDPDIPRCTCTRLGRECQNNGTCTGTNNTCECNPRYGGDYCEIKLFCMAEGSECQNGGLCVVDADETVYCDCRNGYQGPTCTDPIQEDVNVVTAVLVPVVLFVCASILYGAAYWHANYRGPKVNGKAHNELIYKVTFILFDFGTDMAFVIAAWSDGGRLIPEFIAYLSTTFLVLPVLVNLSLSMYFLYRMMHRTGTNIMQSSEMGWFIHPATTPGVTFIWLLSCVNIDLLRLYQSSIFQLSWFEAPWIDDVTALDWLAKCAWLTILLEDIPQVGLQIYMFTHDEPSTITVMATTASTIMIFFPVFEAAIVYLAHKLSIVSHRHNPWSFISFVLLDTQHDDGRSVGSAPNGSAATSNQHSAHRPDVGERTPLITTAVAQPEFDPEAQIPGILVPTSASEVVTNVPARLGTPEPTPAAPGPNSDPVLQSYHLLHSPLVERDLEPPTSGLATEEDGPVAPSTEPLTAPYQMIETPLVERPEPDEEPDE